jgi:hypothetical protein
LRAKRGRASLEFVKACCLEHAKTRVEFPDELLPSLVTGHCGVVFSGRMDVEAVGPYSVLIQVPDRSSTFVYITDEVGEILHFQEVAAPALEGAVAEDSERNL